MDTPWPLLALVLVAVPFVLALRRATDLFVVRVRGGRATFVRGRMPQALLDDIAEVVRTPPVSEAVLRVVRRDGRAELIAKGTLDAAHLQRLRNVIACYSLPRIMAGGRPGRPR